jgi:hypothetical protein
VTVANWKTIRDNIHTVLAAVSGVENVYDGRRGLIDPPEVLDAYNQEDETAFQAWFLYRNRIDNDSSETRRGNIPIRVELWRTFFFEITGYYGYRDEGASGDNGTEDAFGDLLDAIIDAFSNERSLGGFQATPLAAPVIDYEPFSGVLCHKVVLRLAVIVRETGVAPS